MRIVFTVTYDGTGYSGWQVQKNGLGVQEVLERAYIELFGERVRFTASGRTDAGVHAAGQVAHIDATTAVPPEGIMRAMNSVLPPQVKILSAAYAKEGFHARYSAKRKTYVYRAYESRMDLPLKSRFAVKVPTGHDEEKMRAAAKLFEGEHDFSAFCASDSSVKTTTRTIFLSEVVKSGADIEIRLTGNGFLYKMVRTVAGTILAAGENKISEAQILAALETGKRSLVGKTMPPEGLTLESVEYF